MAQPEKYLEIARKGKDFWNAWRRDNPDERANFSGVDFTELVNEDICFAGFEFGDRTDFSKTCFGDTPRAFWGDPEKAVKQGITPEGAAIFVGAVFGESVRFSGSMFGDFARFDDTTFGNSARFASAAFGHAASFDGAAFGHWSRFDEVAFGDGVSFDRVVFGKHIQFAGAAFGGGASFDSAAFVSMALFGKGDPSAFQEAYVGYAGNLPEPHKKRYLDAMKAADHAGFESIYFTRARFGGVADFSGRKFNDSADFSRASFLQPPDFRGTEKCDNLDWTAVRFSLRGELGVLPTPGWTANTETATSLRRLRGIASEIHAHDAERDLFILERMAERGIAWAEWLQKTTAPWKPWWRSRPWRKSWPLKDSWSAWLWRSARAFVATPIPLVYGLARALVLTVLMFLYRLLSDCGRSVVLPLFWLVIANAGFFFWYRGLVAASVLTRVPPETIHDSLIAFTFANALPFVGSSRQAAKDAVEILFGGTMPSAVYGITLFQGLSSVLLLFLLGLALRAHFKVR